MTIAEQIKKGMARKGWTQQSLGTYADVAIATVNKVVNGGMVSGTVLLKLATTLEIKLRIDPKDYPEKA